VQPVLLAGVTVLLISCFPRVQVTPPPATATAKEVALAGAAVLIGAGDIAECGSPGDESTARLIDSVLKADSAAKVEDAVFSVGDHAYPNGTRQDFERCFKPSWGDSSKLIMQRIRPVPGNHEHNTMYAAGYYQFFGDRAGERGKGYYAYDLGTWRIIALNSEIPVNGEFGAEDRTGQEDWLRQELETNKKPCTIAYMHRPLFSSGGHAGDAFMLNLWNILYSGGVDIVISGHDHHYERFLPMNPAGALDTLKGVVQFVVGTGGAGLRGLRAPARNSVARVQGHFGVLKLTLGAGEYRFVFLEPQGRLWDIGGGKCH
jgi:3',5'-cyclic AMP phosphodiesterase CpdA